MAAHRYVRAIVSMETAAIRDADTPDDVADDYD
jgi:hypothetical protein